MIGFLTGLTGAALLAALTMTMTGKNPLCLIGLHHYQWTHQHTELAHIPWIVETHTYTCVWCGDKGHLHTTRRHPTRIP